MKSFFFIFTFFILLAGVSSASTLSGSPSALEYDLDLNEEGCLIFSVYSSDYSGDLYSIMRWAEKDAIVNHPRDFTLNNSEIDLNVDYSPQEIESFDGEEEIEVCISGSEEGYWKGSLEYRTDSGGNIGVGVGTWLRVNITNKPEEPTTTKSPSGSSSSPSSSSSGGSVVEEEQNETPEVIQLNTDISYTGNKESEEESESSEGESSSMTGGIVGAKDSKKDWSKLLFVLGVVILLTIIFTYNKRRKKIE